MMRFITTRLWVCRILRDYPELRDVVMRKELIKKVNKVSNEDLNPETIARMARQIQNTEGLYFPGPEDNRKELEKEYREYFKNEQS